MFSRKSWLNRQRPPDDDELISAYIDGALDSAARQAFEARIASEPDLRRRVDATRRLVTAASQLPLAPVPHNFTLPAALGRPSPSPARWWRVGSALAAAVFVFAIGLDVSGALAPRLSAPAAAPQVAKSFAIQDTGAPAATSAPSLANPVASQPTETAAQATDSAKPTESAPISTPAAPLMGAGGGSSATTVSSSALSTLASTPSPAASAKLPTSDTSSIAGAELVTQAQRNALVMPSATPAGSIAAVPPPAEQPAPITPEPPWLLIVAGLALVSAIGMGIAGWVRH